MIHFKIDYSRHTFALLLFTSFCFFAEGLHIKCRYGTLEKFAVVELDLILLSNLYLCQGKVWTICDASPDCLGVSNDHLPLKEDHMVEFLELRLYSYGPRMPKFIENFFPALLGLNVPFGSIEHISSDDLKYPKLKVLHMQHNKLKTLVSDLFRHTPELIFVGLENNKIFSVGHYVFDSLNRLSVLLLKRNVCIDGEAYTIQNPNSIVELKKRIYSQCEPANDIEDDLHSKELLEDELQTNSVAPYKDCQKYFSIKLDG